ncbi:Thioesterase/thiol ester dehydrase-isomerase, partial [Ramicandelaber brevisporus]
MTGITAAAAAAAAAAGGSKQGSAEAGPTLRQKLVSKLASLLRWVLRVIIASRLPIVSTLLAPKLLRYLGDSAASSSSSSASSAVVAGGDTANSSATNGAISANVYRPVERSASESVVTMTELVLLQHSDGRGYARGGQVLAWIDIAAGLSAKKHAINPCVTRSLDMVHFIHPIPVGDLLILKAMVNRSWRTSMEVGVRVETESMTTGERKFCCQAYLTFVALSPQSGGKNTTEVPKVIVVTMGEKHRYEMAEARRAERLAHAKDKNQYQPEIMDIIRDRHRRMQPRVTWGLRELGLLPDSVDPEHLLSEARRDNLDTVNEESSETASAISSDSSTQLAALGMSQSQPASRARTPSTGSTKRVNRPRRNTIDLANEIGRDIAASYSEVVELVLPQHANSLQITFGGQVMEWMEQCAFAAAARHCRSYMVTASIDSLQFYRPTHVGDIITIRAVVSRTFRASIEVYVTVEAEN